MMKADKKNGFTLLELLVVISICLILGFVIARFGRDIFWQNYTTSKTLVAEGEAKQALAEIATGLRRAQPAATGAYPLELVSSSTIIFFSDIDNNGVAERMRYWRDGVTLKRGVTRPSGQPYIYNLNSENVGIAINNFNNSTGTIFSYYGKNYDGLASSSPLSSPVVITDVRLIKIDLGNLSSQVMLRNLKDNL